jgi:WD40 repeat protein
MKNANSVCSPTTLFNFQVREFQDNKHHEFVILPQELLNTILLNLSLSEISRFSLICKESVHQITSDIDFWKLLYRRDFGMIPPTQNFSMDTFKYHLNLAEGVYSISSVHISDNSDNLAAKPSRERYFAVVGEKFFFYNLEMNPFKNGKIEYLIKSFDLKTNKPLGKLAELNHPISGLAASNGRLFCLKESAVNDEMVSVLDLKTGELLDTINLNGLKCGISCLAVDDIKLFLGMEDGTILIYDLNKKEIIKTLEDLTEDDLDELNEWENWLDSVRVDTLVIADGKLISGTCTNIRFWDLETGNCSKMVHEEFLTFTLADFNLLFLHTYLPSSGSSQIIPGQIIQCWDLDRDCWLWEMDAATADAHPFAFVDGKLFWSYYLQNGGFEIKIANFMSENNEINPD